MQKAPVDPIPRCHSGAGRNPYPHGSTRFFLRLARFTFAPSRPFFGVIPAQAGIHIRMYPHTFLPATGLEHGFLPPPE
jgi:hypothetical protein